MFYIFLPVLVLNKAEKPKWNIILPVNFSIH